MGRGTGELSSMGRVECAGPQTPRWSPGHVGGRRGLDNLGRSASLPLNPVGEIKCPRKLSSSLEMACGQGMSFPLDGSKTCIKWYSL